jgi:DNA-binding transcriptional ArsR family regulator
VIDRLRKELQDRLDRLHAEADKLGRALAALDPRGTPSPAEPKTRPPARSTAAPRPATTTTKTSRRTAPGETKARVLAALSDGKPMTAGEVAAATGLARGTVSTTLSKLAKSGDVRKADRGYQLPTPE